MLPEGCISVPGYENYGITLDGRVWSCSRVVRCNRGVRTTKGKWLGIGINSDGYYSVSLADEKVTVQYFLALTFIGPKPFPNAQVLHKNDVKFDNRIENLYWGTPQENMDDKVRNGNCPTAENHPNSLFTNEQVREIYKRCFVEYMNALAVEFNVCYHTIKNIKARVTYASVTQDLYEQMQND